MLRMSQRALEPFLCSGLLENSTDVRILKGKWWKLYKESKSLLAYRIQFNLLALKLNYLQKVSSFQKSTPGYEKVIQSVPLALREPLIAICSLRSAELRRGPREHNLIWNRNRRVFTVKLRNEPTHGYFMDTESVGKSHLTVGKLVSISLGSGLI